MSNLDGFETRMMIDDDDRVCMMIAIPLPAEAKEVLRTMLDQERTGPDALPVDDQGASVRRGKSAAMFLADGHGLDLIKKLARNQLVSDLLGAMGAKL